MPGCGKRGKPNCGFATTLLVAAITPSHVAVLQVGDGAVIAYNDDQTLSVLSTQQVTT